MKNNFFQNLSLSQKKIIILSFAGLLTLFVFINFVYLPVKKQAKAVKLELLGLDEKIKNIEAIIDKSKTIDEGIRFLQERHAKLSSKFPPKEEEALSALSGLAQKFNVEIVSLRPEPRVLFVDKEGQKVEVDGKACYKILISIEARCSYQDLVGYLEALKESLPAFVRIEKINITKDALGAPKLGVLLDINMYLLS